MQDRPALRCFTCIGIGIRVGICVGISVRVFVSISVVRFQHRRKRMRIRGESVWKGGRDQAPSLVR
jgi:uncharacterized protein (DUF2062 family)